MCTGVPADSDWIYPRDQIEASLGLLVEVDGRAIDESQIQQWVDARYFPIAAAWSASVFEKMGEVYENVISTNRPLNTHQDLKGLFDDLFDGTEVIPSCFEQEYTRMLKDQPLEAAFLRVAISDGQRKMLLKRGLLHGAYGDVADVPYTFERGLNLGFRDDDA